MKTVHIPLRGWFLVFLSLLWLPGQSAREDRQSAATIALGRKLFFDRSLSADGSVSCASCHQPQRAYTDGLRVARGIAGREGTRNTPSLLNANFNQSQFWDGRRPDLESQALDPLLNPKEHGLADAAALLAILRRDRGYGNAFREAFHVKADDIGVQHVRQALACFERSLVTGAAPFDHYYFQGEKNALSASAARGLALFQGAAQCAGCHSFAQPRALFTDHRFHSLGIGLDRIAPKLAELAARQAEGRKRSRQPERDPAQESELAELGRFIVTGDPADIGKFRTPSLRNVAETAPYMHDGSVPTLRAAVEHEIYYRSLESGRPLVLTPAEKDDLVEFLRSLSSSTAPK